MRLVPETGSTCLALGPFSGQGLSKGLGQVAAHAAAREAKENDSTCFAARAAGQAVTTAHVPQHALGGAYYALKAIAAADPANAEVNVAKERDWQAQRLPENLRQEIMNRIIILKNDRGILVKIQKGKDF